MGGWTRNQTLEKKMKVYREAVEINSTIDAPLRFGVKFTGHAEIIYRLCAFHWSTFAKEERS